MNKLIIIAILFLGGCTPEGGVKDQRNNVLLVNKTDHCRYYQLTENPMHLEPTRIYFCECDPGYSCDVNK